MNANKVSLMETNEVTCSQRTGEALTVRLWILGVVTMVSEARVSTGLYTRVKATGLMNAQYAHLCNVLSCTKEGDSNLDRRLQCCSPNPASATTVAPDLRHCETSYRTGGIDVANQQRYHMTMRRGLRKGSLPSESAITSTSIN
jgi:hypothetical protein